MTVTVIPHALFQRLLAEAEAPEPVFGANPLREARQSRRRARRAARRAAKTTELQRETRQYRQERRKATRGRKPRRGAQRSARRVEETPAPSRVPPVERRPGSGWQQSWEPMDQAKARPSRGMRRAPQRGRRRGEEGLGEQGRRYREVEPMQAQEDEGFEEESYEDEGYYEDEGFEEEPYEDEGYDEDEGFEEEPYEDEGYYEDEPPMAAGLADRLPDRWGQRLPLGQNLELRARAGFRAAVIPWKPGMFIVAEVPEDVATMEGRRAEMGLAPVVPALILKSITNRILNRPAPAPAPAAPKTGTMVVPVVSGEHVSPRYARLGWADEADLVEMGCDCQRRKAPRRRR